MATAGKRGCNTCAAKYFCDLHRSSFVRFSARTKPHISQVPPVAGDAYESWAAAVEESSWQPQNGHRHDMPWSTFATVPTGWHGPSDLLIFTRVSPFPADRRARSRQRWRAWRKPVGRAPAMCLSAGRRDSQLNCPPTTPGMVPSPAAPGNDQAWPPWPKTGRYLRLPLPSPEWSRKDGGLPVAPGRPPQN